MPVEKYGWAIQKRLFEWINQDSTFSHTRENSKMLNITSKYFSFFSNKPPASWVAHITRDFLTCYSCSYSSSMIGVTRAIFNLSGKTPFSVDRLNKYFKGSRKFITYQRLESVFKFIHWKCFGSHNKIWFVYKVFELGSSMLNFSLQVFPFIYKESIKPMRYICLDR